MAARRHQRLIGLGLGFAILLAIAAWAVGRDVKSPAQVAAETAAPQPSAITVPVESRTLSSEVIVRGTVRYGSPQGVELGTSILKQNAAGGAGGDVVTRRPQQGTRVVEGSVVMAVSGRPVFVLGGGQPSHRDLTPGSRGPDVRQLEGALQRMGLLPGRLDGRYDGATGAAVAALYERHGYAPFGATDAQREQLRTARANAAQAREAWLQTLASNPGDLAQAAIDLETARDAINTAVHDVAAQARAVPAAVAGARHDDALAAAELAGKQAAVNKAVNALTGAQRDLAEAPPDTPPSALAALQAAVREAGDDVAVARVDLAAAHASTRATREAGRDAVAKARADDVRARRALSTARRQAGLAAQRLQVLRAPASDGVQRRISESAAAEARATAGEAARLARGIGVSVPADELLFFPALPLRVDSVRVRRGDTVSGRVMTVSNSLLAVDSSLSLTDAKLVRVGAPVRIEEPDLGIRTTGTVTRIADRPGTNKVDPSRVYLEVTPSTAPAQLLGASVKLSIAVKSTARDVLAVPITALSVGADAGSRVEVQQRGGRRRYVRVQPGLAANGLVEVRPVGGGLTVGDLVIVGQRGSIGGGTGTAGRAPRPPSGASASNGG